MIKGYAGRVLEIDLGSQEFAFEPLDEETARLYIGGKGYGTRLLWEWARFLLPVIPVIIFLAAYKLLVVTGVASRWTLSNLALVPAVLLGVAMVLCLLVLTLKWLLLGRVQPGQHPLWSCWCSRWDFLYVAWNAWARAALTTLEGTPLLPWYLRAMGMRVGRRGRGRAWAGELHAGRGAARGDAGLELS